MKRYRYQGIRNPKTDRIDSLIIAQYGIDYWYKKNESLIMNDVREELRFLGKQYVQFMKTRSKGWRLIRTEDGRLGYVKANMLENEYIVRQDWNDKIETKELAMDLQDGSQITLYRDNQTSTKIKKVN